MKFGEEIFSKTPKSLPKEMWKVDDGAHIDSFWVEKGRYRQIFLDYLEKI
jgi:fermentation-respiration switch protein FrsA (DUF1100 family)